MKRRKLLKYSLGSGAYGALSLSLGTRIGMLSADTSAGDYKALVCIYLLGGNDSFNMIIPKSTAEYDVYASARQNLAVPQQDILSVNAHTNDGVDYGINKNMPAVRSMFEVGAACVVANVGSLIVPTSQADYLAGSVPLPKKLFSHNNQQEFWFTCDPSANGSTGWAGRIAEALPAENIGSNLPMNISLYGNNLWQVGGLTTPYSVSSAAINSFAYMKQNGSIEQVRRYQAFKSMQQHQNNHLFEQEYTSVLERADILASEAEFALSQSQQVAQSFDTTNSIGSSLEMVANLISARQILGVTRQIFYVGFGGWDTHGNQLVRHPTLLQQLDRGLSDFYAATVEMGVEDNVSAFTGADFGRTLTSNGDGSDHGWGGHQLVVGGAVQGQKIYGAMPDLQIEGSQDIGGGRIIPSISVDQYGATLAKWFGCSDTDMDMIFPNLENFQQRDLGFMSEN